MRKQADAELTVLARRFAQAYPESDKDRGSHLEPAGLFLRSLQSASGIDIGFQSHGVLKMSIDPQVQGYTFERSRQFLMQARERVATLPGVRSAAWTDLAPLSIGGRRDGFRVEGDPLSQGAELPVDLYMVISGYFETLGIPRVAGADFAHQSSAGPKRAVVNEKLAQSLFPNENPIGRRVTGGGETYEIIGVVKNMKSRTLGEAVRPVLYRSLEQGLGGEASFLGLSLLVRYEGSTETVAAAVRQQIRSMDSAKAIFNMVRMQEHVRDALFLPRLAGTVFGVFGFVGLLLEAIGLYGVMSHRAAGARAKMGIGIALGARLGDVQRLVVRQGMLVTLIALAPGLAAVLAVARLFTSVLYGIQPHDAATFTLVPVFLAAVAFLACWIPSRRASRVNPLKALLYE